MTRAFSERCRRLLAALTAVAAVAVPLGVRAELQTDPTVLYTAMKAAYDKGAAAGWHFGDELNYFSTVLDAGRAYELRRRDDPENAALKGTALDLATRLNYDPLDNHDAAEWYLRLAAQTFASDAQRGAEAAALTAKFDAEDADPERLAHDADADSTANVKNYPDDAQALLAQVQADVAAYSLTKDVYYRSLALTRAAQAAFPVAIVTADTDPELFALANAAKSRVPGYSASDIEAANAFLSHKATTKSLAVIGRVRSANSVLVITAPADEYFGHTKLSPIGVRNALLHIEKYLDAGWGAHMTRDALYVVDALDDWREQYPRDYELPRLLLQTYRTLDRIDSPQAHDAEARVRKLLTVDYNASSEAQSLLNQS